MKRTLLSNDCTVSGVVKRLFAHAFLKHYIFWGALVVACAISTPANAQANQQCVRQCESGNCVSGDMSLQRLQLCRAACVKSCANGSPSPIGAGNGQGLIYPRYLILTLIYAPPGCGSITPPVKCGASSMVDYQSGSSNGTKISTQSSFKDGSDVSLGASLNAGMANFGASVNGGVSTTASDSKTITISKSQSLDIKTLGTIDGIDHGQDQFVLLLNPAISVRAAGTNVVWNIGYSGTQEHLYTLTVSWLKNPSSMPSNVALQLKTLGFTTNDYQQILAQDPFVNGSTTIDSNRFVPTTFSFPYEPPPSCSTFSQSIKNELVNEVSTGVQNQYSAGFTASAGTPVASLKISTNWTWTNSAAAANTTDSSQSATVTVACPSASYNGPTNMAIYWDTLYGSFMFQPLELTPSTLVQQGHVTDASGKPVAQQLVELSYNGKTYHTVTSGKGDYRFFALPNPKIVSRPATGQLSVGNMKQVVNLGIPTPTQVHLIK
jgi:hypothetical protein